MYNKNDRIHPRFDDYVKFDNTNIDDDNIKNWAKDFSKIPVAVLLNMYKFFIRVGESECEWAEASRRFCKYIERAFLKKEYNWETK